MIEGKLGDNKREPINIQVPIEEDHGGAESVCLIDADGALILRTSTSP